MTKKELEQFNKLILENPDFVFYDWDNECIGKDLQIFISQVKTNQYKECQKYVDAEGEIARQLFERLITQEIAIAQKEGQPTSRLTSLFNKIKDPGI